MDKILKKCNTATSANKSSLAVFKITGETGTNWIELCLKFIWSDPSGNLFAEEIQLLWESYQWISLRKEFPCSAIKKDSHRNYLP